MSDIVELDISEISEDPLFNFRAELNKEKLEEYTARCRDAKKHGEPFPFPSLVVYKMKEEIFRLAGAHRLLSAKKTDWTTVPARFFEGNLKDALRFGLSDNRHGAALTRGDKRVSIELALKKKLYKSNRELARAIGCDEKYVRLIKDEIEGKISPKVRSAPQPASSKPRFKSVDELFKATIMGVILKLRGLRKVGRAGELFVGVPKERPTVGFHDGSKTQNRLAASQPPTLTALTHPLFHDVFARPFHRPGTDRPAIVTKTLVLHPMNVVPHEPDEGRFIIEIFVWQGIPISFGVLVACSFYHMQSHGCILRFLPVAVRTSHVVLY